MGQAFRRAAGRTRPSSAVDPPPPSKSKITRDLRPSEDGSEISRAGRYDVVEPDGAPKVNTENVIEEKDPKYDVMLNQMVGRITSKPGGKHEMGEASVVERYKRPMPKVRDTTPDSSRYEDRPAPPGTLNVAQLRHIMLLYQGKADDHNGPMDVHQIAEKFRLDVRQVQNILQVVSLPPEDSGKQKKHM